VGRGVKLLGPHIVHPGEAEGYGPVKAWTRDPLTGEIVYLIPSPNSLVNHELWMKLRDTPAWRWAR
jgi:hypothetical protein